MHRKVGAVSLLAVLPQSLVLVKLSCFLGPSWAPCVAQPCATCAICFFGPGSVFLCCCAPCGCAPTQLHTRGSRRESCSHCVTEANLAGALPPGVWHIGGGSHHPQAGSSAGTNQKSSGVFSGIVLGFICWQPVVCLAFCSVRGGEGELTSFQIFN